MKGRKGEEWRRGGGARRKKGALLPFTFILYIYKPFLGLIHKTNLYTNIKHAYTNITLQVLEEFIPVTDAYKARVCWYRRPIRPIYQYRLQGKKAMDRNNTNWKTLDKFIMANTSAIRQQAAHTAYRLSSLSCSTRAIQQQKVELLTKIF